MSENKNPLKKYDSNANGKIDSSESTKFVGEGLVSKELAELIKTADITGAGAGADYATMKNMATNTVRDRGVNGIMDAAKQAGLTISPEAAKAGLDSLAPPVTTPEEKSFRYKPVGRFGIIG